MAVDFVVVVDAAAAADDDVVNPHRMYASEERIPRLRRFVV